MWLKGIVLIFTTVKKVLSSLVPFHTTRYVFFSIQLVLILFFKYISSYSRPDDTNYWGYLIRSDTSLDISSVFLNNMFHALVGRFKLELFMFITYFPTVIPLTSIVFFPVGLSSLTRLFQQVL